MTNEPAEKFLVSGLGDNTLLICNWDPPTCEWSMPFPMSEPVTRLLHQLDNHAFTNHGWVRPDPPCCKREGCAHPHDRLEKPTDEVKAETKHYRLARQQGDGYRVTPRDEKLGTDRLFNSRAEDMAFALSQDRQAYPIDFAYPPEEADRRCGGCGEPVGDGSAHGPGVCV